MLMTFILLMVVTPSVQQAAHEELDRVCPNRLVTSADRSSLPYIESIIMEVCRYQPVLPIGVPHRLDEDDVFEGMRLPKGSVMLPNVWCGCPRNAEALMSYNVYAGEWRMTRMCTHHHLRSNPRDS